MANAVFSRQSGLPMGSTASDVVASDLFDLLLGELCSALFFPLGLPSLGISILCIFKLSAKEQVTRVDAWRIVAGMKNALTRENRTEIV